MDVTDTAAKPPRIDATAPADADSGLAAPSAGLLLEIDGPDVSPRTIDVPALLEIASAFFSLVQRNSVDLEAPMSLTGLEIIDKCVALVVPVPSRELARECALRTTLQVSGQVEPPHGFAGLVNRARGALRKLPPTQRVTIQLDAWHRELLADVERPLAPLDSLLAIRAVPVRAGGKRPAVRFRSDLEVDSFTLETSPEQARELGARLYREVDIYARVSRDPEGSIENGRLEHFEDVAESDPRPRWREWFADVHGIDSAPLDDGPDSQPSPPTPKRERGDV